VSTRVLIADDHGVVRRGLRHVLSEASDIDVVGDAADGQEAVRLAAELHPQVVILDVAMPKLNGIQAAAQMLKKDPQIGIIMLSMYSDEEYIVRALASGAKGYLLKESAEPDLINAVRAVARGRSYFSSELSEVLMEDYLRRVREEGIQDPYDTLTDREKEILHLLAQAKSNKEVASILNLSLYTVETHRTNLMQKLDLHSAAEIVLYAVKKKLVF
jgi:two-component system response regulator NreC